MCINIARDEIKHALYKEMVGFLDSGPHQLLCATLLHFKVFVCVDGCGRAPQSCFSVVPTSTANVRSIGLWKE